MYGIAAFRSCFCTRALLVKTKLNRRRGTFVSSVLTHVLSGANGTDAKEIFRFWKQAWIICLRSVAENGLSSSLRSDEPMTTMTSNRLKSFFKISKWATWNGWNRPGNNTVCRLGVCGFCLFFFRKGVRL